VFIGAFANEKMLDGSVSRTPDEKEKNKMMNW
jgi:hypothetical protein